MAATHSKKMLSSSLVLLLFVFAGCRCHVGQALSSPETSSNARRDLLIKAPIGAVFTYAYGRVFYNTLSNIGIKHPEEHESRVRSTIYRTLAEAATTVSLSKTIRDQIMMRVLEVGIGSDCRLIRRNLYDEGLQAAKEQGITKVQLVGVDLQVPNQNTLQLARNVFEKSSSSSMPAVDLQILQQSIADRLPFDDGSFDAIVCCLTLCSVDEPVLAVREMNRLLRPSGGALGYVEHVAVNPDETDYSFLEKQQVFFDPWQQRLADNCHLHRYTEQTLRDNLETTALLQNERFLVNSMWPVSMQCCGVMKKSVA